MRKPDVVDRMHSRGLIDKASVKAARQFQALRLRSPRDPDARKTLYDIELKLAREVGLEGVSILRDVLLAGMTIAAAAAARGETNKSLVDWFGGWFRRCLHQLAVILTMPVAA